MYQKGGFGNLGLPMGCSRPVVADDGNRVEEEEDDEPLSFLEYMLLGTVR